MSWIRAVDPQSATEEVAQLFERVRAASSRGHVAGLWRALGSDPAGLEALFRQHQALMSAPAPLETAEAELIAVVVSALNGCGYCVSHHGPRLARALGDETLARSVAHDYREADLPARSRVLLDYAVALTCEPAERQRADVERLREYGYDDRSILRATEVVAHYNAVNRIVNALGVSLEPGLAAWEYGTQR